MSDLHQKTASFDAFVNCAMVDRFVEETVRLSPRRKQRSTQEMKEQTIGGICNV